MPSNSAGRWCPMGSYRGRPLPSRNDCTTTASEKVMLCIVCRVHGAATVINAVLTAKHNWSNYLQHMHASAFRTVGHSSALTHMCRP